MSKPKLKIGFVFDDSLDKPDGVQQYVLTLGAWLVTQGHTVHYLTGETTRTDLPHLFSLSRNVHMRFNGNRMAMPLPTPRRKLKELLEREHYDVLHVQAPFSPWLAGRIIDAAAPTTAIVATFHILPQGFIVSTASRLLGLWTHRSWKRIDHVFSVSPAAAAFAKRVFRVESSVLPNVVDIERFKRALPRQLGVKKTMQILFLGRLVPRKGCRTLLEAVKLLQKDTSLPSFKLTVCGKGPLMEELTHYVADNHLNAVVEFVGFVTETDKPGYYAGADIAVFPSYGGESFGIVLVEAMASGNAAVLAGDNPGYHSVVAANEQLFPIKDAASLAESLRLCLTDTAERERLAALGAERAQSFDTGRVGKDLLETYQSLYASKNVR